MTASSGDRRNSMRIPGRLALACLIGATVTTICAFAGYFALAIIPGTPNNALLRGAIRAASQGEQEFVLYFFAPETEAVSRSSDLWYDFTIMPLAVIVGSLVSVRLSKRSWLCAAIGGVVPMVTLTLVGPLGGADPGAGVVGVLVIIVAAWIVSIALARRMARCWSQPADSCLSAEGSGSGGAK